MTRIPGVGKFCPRGPGQPGAITATGWQLQNLPQRPHAVMVKLLITTQGHILPRRGTELALEDPTPSSELLSIGNSRPHPGPHPPVPVTRIRSQSPPALLARPASGPGVQNPAGGCQLLGGPRAPAVAPAAAPSPGFRSRADTALMPRLVESAASQVNARTGPTSRRKAAPHPVGGSIRALASPQ